MNIEQVLARQPEAGRALYVDMNSFFASVEQQVKPHLRGKPVGVCPFVNDHTCVIAASIEAKRHGVKTGTNVAKARRLCPDIILIADDPKIYRQYHRQIMAALETTRCQVYVKSIDEAFLEVPSDLRPRAVELAQEVKGLVADIGSQLGCSIGVASNLFLAKMGTKLHKPRGLVEVRNEDLEAMYAALHLTDLTGISWRMARRLALIGIESALDFYHADYRLLKDALGVNGERWYLRLRGYEVDNRPTTRRMVGHQTTVVPEPARSREEVLSVASQLCYKAAARLRASELAASSVHVYLRFTDRTAWSRTLRTHSPFWDSATLYNHASRLIQRWVPSKEVRLVAVSSFDLTPMTALTRPLFKSSERDERLSRAIDEIESQWGRHTIQPALQMLGSQVVDRVGFGNAGQVAQEVRN